MLGVATCDFTIRKVTEFDIDKIMRIESESFSPSVQESREVFVERIRQCPDLFFVFEDLSAAADEKIAGYISAEIMTEIPEKAEQLSLNHLPSFSTHEIESNNQFIYISSFAILKKYRGLGVGKKLWADSLKMFETSSSVKKFLLLVNSAWKGAKHIYEENGFSEINVFKNFFPDGDGILMGKF